MKVWTYKFTVEGAGSFPTDMLRYDECFPDRSEDAICIGDRFPEGTYRVTLRKKSEEKRVVVTDRRWESFGWRVIEIEKPVALEVKEQKAIDKCPRCGTKRRKK